MKLKEVFAARDQATKQALFQKFPDNMEEIQAVFRDSSQAWHEEYVILFGQEGAERIKLMADEEI